jgi:squalene-associated FAD-dependent desaturase
MQRGRYRIDNGQHIALRCCTEYRRLLSRLGVERLLDVQPRLRIPVLRAGARPALLDRSAAPAPFHLAGALLRYHHLSPPERLRALEAIAALRRLDLEDPSLDTCTFGDWLSAHGQSQRIVDRLWNLIALPTLNLPAAHASLSQAAFVFRTGLLDESDACDLAIPSVSLGELHGDAAASVLRARGVDLRLRTRVRAISRSGESFETALAGGRSEFDRIVCAVPHEVAPRILPRGVADADALRRLGASPIVNVHLNLDRVVLATPVAAVLDSPLQWVFDRTDASGVERGQLLSISLSSAAREMRMPQDDLVGRMLAALRDVVPAARDATVLDAAVTREPRATFRAAPGSRALRPQARTALRGLALAGAWTDTGWPATMEGAVRSGRAAAAVVLAEPVAAVRRRPRTAGKVAA